MRRWNGWGDDAIDFPVPESALVYLEAHLGEGKPHPDASIKEILKGVPNSRLSEHPLICIDSRERLLHARGQSLPDWIAMRSGRIEAFPDGVAYPASQAEVRELIGIARRTGATLIPYGGGTSVVGHINPIRGERPVLSVDLSRMNRLLYLDETSRLATFEAGVCGPDLEAQLNQRDYTLGHYPQSFELSTLGGWIATRSSGQQSYHYGRIESLFAGGYVETPQGSLELPCLPASAAGPDMRHLILGSEGRFGIITSATVRVRKIPEQDSFYGIFFRDWESGVAAVREIAQAGVQVSMLRLSDAQETETTLALSGKERLVSWAERGLGVLGYHSERCMLVCGITGDTDSASLARGQVREVARAHGGLYAGETIGKMWRKSRFLTPYLRNALWDLGYAVDTLETALPWSGVLSTALEVKAAIRNGLVERGEQILVFAHLSHVYVDGASIYFTYIFRRAEDPLETLGWWNIMKAAASQVIGAKGGTISHQHGVGIDHAVYLEGEKGPLGIAALRAASEVFDPEGLMNPGKMFSR
jgi:alkyldihydroxyacetonephosphate synthase